MSESKGDGRYDAWLRRNPPHPGGYVGDWMEDADGRRMTVVAAAARLGVSQPALSRILNGRAGISLAMALKLEAVGWGAAETWVRMQANYDLVQERMRCVQWIQQALDQINVQVHLAVSDLTGQTGMAIVRANVAGERDARQLAALRGKRCRKSEEEFAQYLTGNWRDEHLFNLRQALELYDTQQQIAVYEQVSVRAGRERRPWS